VQTALLFKATFQNMQCNFEFRVNDDEIVYTNCFSLPIWRCIVYDSTEGTDIQSTFTLLDQKSEKFYHTYIH